MKRKIQTGIIGCGNISQAYFDASAKFDIIKIKGCADLNDEVAAAKARQNSVLAMTVEELLSDPEIQIVINLTIPQAHAEVNISALEAGKHVHCEKPFAVERNDGKKVLQLSENKGLLTGCAPDTFLGGGLQTCRKLIDDGWIGKPVSGMVFMCNHGHESWHPNPGFYYQLGGGPLFDMGPYYLTALVHLLGPVKKAAAICGRAFGERTATSPDARGKVLPVEVNTHVAGTLEFHCGAIITLVMSFDVWKCSCPHIEIHGTMGSLKAPNPNHFGGPVHIFRQGMADWQKVPLSHEYTDNMRIIGAADMAYAIGSGRTNRCSGEMAYHVLDVMHALEESSLSGKQVIIDSSCVQPKPLPIDLPAGQLDD